MNRGWPISEIYYPESDGQPMAETPLHQAWMIRLLDLFQRRYHGQSQVFVGSNLMVYFTQGNLDDCLAPDLIVLLQSDRRPRRVLKLWEEPQTPSLVMEITSRSTQLKDSTTKFERYERQGIAEYLLYDPAKEYLAPPLQGHRLNDQGRYLPIEFDHQGQLVSEQTGIAFSLNEQHELLLYDVATGNRLLTDAEAERQAKVKERQAKLRERRAKLKERQAKEAAERRAGAERQARLQAETRIAELESEMRRIRGE